MLMYDALRRNPLGQALPLVEVADKRQGIEGRPA